MEIELFQTPGCGRCVYLKELLNKAGVKYQTVDVASGLGPLRRLRRLTGEARVPVLAVGQAWWPAHEPDQAETAVQEVLKLTGGSRGSRG